MIDNDEILIKGHDRDTLFQNSLLRTNIFAWYDFVAGGSLALVGEDCPVIKEYFHGLGLSVTHFTEEMFAVCTGDFDYVILLGALSQDLLPAAKKCLGPEGVLFIAVNNKEGMTYKAGLPGVTKKGGPAAIKRADLAKMLSRAGLNELTWYYPYPDYRLATEIFSDRHLPGAELVETDFPSYEGDYLPAVDVVAFYERALSEGAVASAMNSFLIVCKNCEVSYVKYNTLRAPRYRLTTIIGSENGAYYVEKRTQDERARGHLSHIEDNFERMRAAYNMISPVPFRRINEDRVRFDYVDGRSLLAAADFEEIVLPKLMCHVEAGFATIFSTELDNMCAFDISEDFSGLFPGVDASALIGAEAFRVSNPDSIFDNFLLGDEIFLIDYEWLLEFPIPVCYLKYRALLYLYRGHRQAFERAGLSVYSLFEAGGIEATALVVCEEMEHAFQLRIHGEDLKYNYLPHYRWRTWEKKDAVEFKLRQLKNKIKKE